MLYVRALREGRKLSNCYKSNNNPDIMKQKHSGSVIWESEARINIGVVKNWEKLHFTKKLIYLWNLSKRLNNLCLLWAKGLTALCYWKSKSLKDREKLNTLYSAGNTIAIFEWTSNFEFFETESKHGHSAHFHNRLILLPTLVGASCPENRDFKIGCRVLVHIITLVFFSACNIKVPVSLSRNLNRWQSMTLIPCAARGGV